MFFFLLVGTLFKHFKNNLSLKTKVAGNGPVLIPSWSGWGVKQLFIVYYIY